MPEDRDPATGASHEPVTWDVSAAPAYPPMPVKSVTVIKVAMALWTIALAVTLAVPELRSGDRHWWPWACVAGLGLGLVGYLYIRRGRGNAAGVE